MCFNAIRENKTQENTESTVPVFGVSNQVRLKSNCSATEASLNVETFHVASLAIIHSREK